MAAVYVPSRAIPTLTIRKRVVALFGMLALFSMLALTSWHDGLPHVDDVEHAQNATLDHHEQAADHREQAADHDDDGDDQPGSGTLIHGAAHAALQTIDLPTQPVVAGTLARARNHWTMAPADRIDSVKPDSLLRPPRA